MEGPHHTWKWTSLWLAEINASFNFKLLFTRTKHTHTPLLFLSTKQQKRKKFSLQQNHTNLPGERKREFFLLFSFWVLYIFVLFCLLIVSLYSSFSTFFFLFTRSNLRGVCFCVFATSIPLSFAKYLVGSCVFFFSFQLRALSKVFIFSVLQLCKTVNYNTFLAKVFK